MLEVFFTDFGGRMFSRPPPCFEPAVFPRSCAGRDPESVFSFPTVPAATFVENRLWRAWQFSQFRYNTALIGNDGGTDMTAQDSVRDGLALPMCGHSSRRRNGPSRAEL